MAEIGAIAERRIALLIDANLSGLPPFLVARSRAEFGLHDRARHRRRAGEREQVAGASGQRRQPAHLGQPGRPRVAWPPSRRAGCAPMAANVRRIVAIELLAAAQGIDLRAPLRHVARRSRAPATLVRVGGELLRSRPLLAPDIEAVDANDRRASLHGRREQPAAVSVAHRRGSHERGARSCPLHAAPRRLAAARVDAARGHPPAARTRRHDSRPPRSRSPTPTGTCRCCTTSSTRSTPPCWWPRTRGWWST